jgi:hypothetical protein
MDENLLAAYRESTYLVCLDTLHWSAIHVDEPLPAALQAVVGTHDWGFITAWNPRSVPRPDEENLAAQQQLLAALRGDDAVLAIHPGVGVGISGSATDWYEPSLFVIGAGLLDAGTGTLERLCREYAQHAYVCGRAHAPARLRVLPPGAVAACRMDKPHPLCGQSGR